MLRSLKKKQKKLILTQVQSLWVFKEEERLCLRSTVHFLLLDVFMVGF